MIKDIRSVSDSYFFNNDIIIYEKMNMFYFKVVINSSSCTILSHNHKIINESDIIINSIWKDVYDFINLNILPKQKLISQLYDNVIIGFLYCPSECPLKINYSHFYNTLNENNKFIISNVKTLNKNEIDITEFCKSINLLNIRGVGGGPKILYNENYLNTLNDYAHNKISLSEFITISTEHIKTYSGNDLGDIEGIIIKDNRNTYQIIINSTEDSKTYNRDEFEVLIKSFIDTWEYIKYEINYTSYKEIICDIFLKYINSVDVLSLISNSDNLIPPGNHHIGDLSYELLNNKNVETLCKINDVYKNIFRILFKGLKHHKKDSKYNSLPQEYINKWNNIVDYIITKKRD